MTLNSLFFMGSIPTHLTHPLTPSYNKKDAKETARYKWVLLVTQLFNIAVNYFDVKKSAR